ncbi:hypothetical protein QUF70_14830 [Desulfobacterales bacterium HSG17]|nr:hypothetical protein [Desulfobacterales bacterium HSG17]
MSLYTQGYEKENIKFLSMKSFIDVTGDGENDVDAPATLSELSSAIQTWAVDSSELILYMTGPGRNNAFQLKTNAAPEFLIPDTLNTWLNNLSAKIIIIYDAPMSGSFIPFLKGNERIIITATSENERAWFLNDGEISFSFHFWNSVFFNSGLDNAFENGQNMVNSIQTPIMNINGSSARKSARQTGVSIGRGRLVETAPPAIKGQAIATPSNLTANQTLSNISISQIEAQNGIGRVWARIYSPFEDYVSPDTPVSVLPTIKLFDLNQPGTYENTYEKFIQTGIYNIYAYVKDKKDFQSLPAMTTVIKGGGINPGPGDMNLDGAIDLKDAITALKIAAGLNVTASAEFEVSGDSRIGVEDAIAILRQVAELK